MSNSQLLKPTGKWFFFVYFPAYVKALRNFASQMIILAASHFGFGMDMIHRVQSTGFTPGHNYQLTSIYFFSPLIFFFSQKGIHFKDSKVLNFLYFLTEIMWQHNMQILLICELNIPADFALKQQRWKYSLNNIS